MLEGYTYQMYLDEWNGRYGEDVDEAEYSGKTVHRLTEEEFNNHSTQMDRILDQIRDIQTSPGYGPSMSEQLKQKEDRLFQQMSVHEIALLS